MVMQVSVDIRQAKKRLKKAQRKQIPFAASKALNDTAFTVRKFVVNTLYPRSFRHARNRRFPNVAFRVQRATKRRLRARVYDRLDRYFLPLHETGRDKRARSGKLAVPIQAQRTATGRIRAADQPNRLTEGFVADLKGKGPALWVRRRGRLKLMYVLKSTTPIDQRFPLTRLGEAKGRQVWPRHFRRALRRALATAR